MRREERRTIAIAGILLALGVVGAVLFPIALYLFGLSVAPPRPIPPRSSASALVLDALWTRAGGGRATSLRPIDHIAIAQMAACVIQAEGANDNERFERCRHVLPAMPGLEYLSALHIKDNGGERNSFLGGHGAMGTTIWMTRSWSKEEFLNTLAARGLFGYGWRGVTTAAQGYFGLDDKALTIAQAAFLASRVGDTGPDPWCHAMAATAMRDRILAGMRDNGAITDADFQHASRAPLGLAAPPKGRPGCRD